MPNPAEFVVHTEGPQIGHPHTPELMMRWIDVCTDSRLTGTSRTTDISNHSIAHPHQLVAIWIEQGVSPPQRVC
jgi:hypothetical protein